MVGEDGGKGIKSVRDVCGIGVKIICVGLIERKDRVRV